MNAHSPPSPPAAATLQARLCDFALDELVRRHRDSFQPLWTVDSWAKLLIWLALNCGCSGDEAGLRAFADSIGPSLSSRLRRRFFERELEGLALQLLADPAEPRVMVLAADASLALPPPDRLQAALASVGLEDRLAPEGDWQWLEGAVAIPWRQGD